MKKWLFCVGFLLLGPVNLQAADVAREPWIDGMKKILPEVFCRDSAGYFRQCFDISSEKCFEIAASVTESCLDENLDQIPTTLKQPDDGRVWGQTIGTCAGTRFEAGLIQFRKSNPKCNNPSNWRQ
ncbi:MAG: hypothetical protein ABW101_00225 [Candidatus Thiodiazotropha sp.]